ncbi:MAG: aminotransferase class I/II-fold pyridoxal phosphate-dependent enzyme [Deltaproteobacteria bacterium]|jgi:methionine-gamma-lyase|nr:aminotransferase class I/II-fold pyridoxal phosphate-dependent enzyme [Deltaproteobacteria bacterium]MBT4264800.1 aminotransferase class I/II-fold pyridoxal phosphate-dependent enzyme [Deltaproteobacteria bacterium]MBT4639768.1 aminotransferase class I/II-fold pyridoxal phosphate-dependent enzyme [Deltaproteobacteria bacterium]MBT6614621.1 aminotransferase class I/II-fold pyridoxal phosphate-dependent enzyme [Deltaproteobacteria bacterium]MBT7153113.1 aminotransferase class I/II-fold pyridox
MAQFNPEQALWHIRREFGEHGGVAPSISRSSTFTVLDPGIMPDIFKGVRGPEKGGYFLYSRHFNPTVDTLARELAALENTEAAICTSSGMSAIACSILQLCRAGDHVVASNTIYGGTHALLEHLLPEIGIKTSFVNISDHAEVQAAISSNTKLIFTESVGNPTLQIANIPMLAKIAHESEKLLVVDNTFTPMIITPSFLGADIVVSSLTKFVNGASDVIAGVICSSKEFVYQLTDLHTGRIMLFGPTMDARTAFDIQQRLPHLSLRMKEHSVRAQAVAELLNKVKVNVIYPGLVSHPEHELMKSMLNDGYGYGGILAVDCLTQERAETFMSLLQNKERFGLIAVSLGYFDTLMSCSGSSTASEIGIEDQRAMGLSPGLVRLSIGITGSLPVRLEQIERAAKETGLI